ncbi:coiled-coil domain-containing protein [Citrobacter freundii complex sp. 2024EL-00237]|uniref:coiled-coil domain-containing protein n=1 Tax=Citrobacter freundii complex sp. 2024EL-00237 TaxID=3374253 RepID=UPI0037536F8C
MLESLKEYFSSTVNTATQRVSNPVFGAFAISWSAFNWKSILYLFLSDSGIIDKITYISDNSNWKTMALYPCISVAVLCCCLPWINNLISAWQAKPLDNNDSIENHRKAKRILLATRLQRLQAKHDVTYDKVKTGAEKNIQAMKEEIVKSKESMGELTAELNAKNEKLDKAYKELKEASIKIESLDKTVSKLTNENKSLDDRYETLLTTFNNFKVTVEAPSATNNGWLGSPNKLNELDLRVGGKGIFGNSIDGDTANKVYQKANSFLNVPNRDKKD